MQRVLFGCRFAISVIALAAIRLRLICLRRVCLGLARAARTGFGLFRLAVLRALIGWAASLGLALRLRLVTRLARRTLLGRGLALGRFDQRAGLAVAVRILNVRLRADSGVMAAVALITLMRAVIALLRAVITLIRAITVDLAVPVLAFLLLSLGIHLLLGFAQKSQVMLSVLLEILGCDAIIRQLRITRQLVVLFNDLLRRTAHLALRARAVEHAVHDIADRIGAISVRLVART